MDNRPYRLAKATVELFINPKSPRILSEGLNIAKYTVSVYIFTIFL